MRAREAMESLPLASQLETEHLECLKRWHETVGTGVRRSSDESSKNIRRQPLKFNSYAYCNVV